MTKQQLYELNQERGVQAIRLTNPHPYPITLDLFNNWGGIDSSYYHEPKTATPRFKNLAVDEEITLTEALFVQVFGGDVEVTDMQNGSVIIYNGQDTLLEHGINFTNQVTIKALGNPVALMWTKADTFLNDTGVNPRQICSIKFFPSDTDFYMQPIKWMTQDMFGNKNTAPIPFSDFGAHYRNSMYLLPVDRELSSSTSIRLTLPAKSSLSAYVYVDEQCIACEPCCDVLPEKALCPVVPDCPDATFPYWLIPFFIVIVLMMLFFHFPHNNS